MELTPAPEQNHQAVVNEIYQYAANLLFREKRSYADVMNLLKERGLDEASADIVITNLEDRMKSEKRAAAKKDMLYGALWCIGGTVLTMAHIGFIFWGAIVFGAVQFFRGAANM